MECQFESLLTFVAKNYKLEVDGWLTGNEAPQKKSNVHIAYQARMHNEEGEGE